MRLLSGGNAQKLMLAREFAGDMSMLIAHSPTRGLDIRAVQAVQARLRAAAEAGVAVLLISEDLDEIMRTFRPRGGDESWPHQPGRSRWSRWTARASAG